MPLHLTENDEFLVKQLIGQDPFRKDFVIACSDEVSNLSTGTSKITFRSTSELSINEIRASVATAPVGSSIIIDVKQNGVSLFSSLLQIDAGSKTSVTSSSPPVLSTTILDDDAEITIDIIQVGASTPGTGLKVAILGSLIIPE
jgi:hypothetical protein